MLTAAELADLRADILETLPDTCTIQRPTEVTDAYGNTAKTWPDTYTGVACRIDPFNARGISDGVIALREASISWYQLTVPWNTDLRYGDRIVFGGDTYELVQLIDDHSLRAVRRAVIAKLQGT